MCTSMEHKVSAMTSPVNPKAHVVGLGLIGGSVARALTAGGWTVTGIDGNSDVSRQALELGIVTDTEPHSETSLVFICTPAGVVAKVAKSVLAQLTSPELIVTDVAGVKASIVEAVSDPRFIGGHPMAGSEMRGLEGSRADLFTGCTWVLTPSEDTSADNYARLHSILRDIGASVMALQPADHDRMVAMASHVPHLVSGALMNEASTMAESDGALLRLAAGGFRDMTRISAGDPAIWPDILFENAPAVLGGLRGIQDRLARLTAILESGDRDNLLQNLATAAEARRHMPGRTAESSNLTEVRIPVPDRPGVLAEVTTLASNLQINIFDIEIAHSVEGSPGVLLLALEMADASTMAKALRDQGFSVGGDV